MDDINPLFLKIGEAAANQKGDNFLPGSGRAVITQCIYNPAANDGPTYIARFKILESKDKPENAATGQSGKANPPGSRVGWPQKLAKFKSAMGNVKAMVLNTLGYKEADVSKEDFARAFNGIVSKDQPFRGMLLDYDTYQQQVKSGDNKGKWNTYVRFTHVPATGGNSPEDVAKRRAELDVSDPIVG